jgi:hypothetical protein
MKAVQNYSIDVETLTVFNSLVPVTNRSKLIEKFMRKYCDNKVMFVGDD